MQQSDLDPFLHAFPSSRRTSLQSLAAAASLNHLHAMKCRCLPRPGLCHQPYPLRASPPEARRGLLETTRVSHPRTRNTEDTGQPGTQREDAGAHLPFPEHGSVLRVQLESDRIGLLHPRHDGETVGKYRRRIKPGDLTALQTGGIASTGRGRQVRCITSNTAGAGAGSARLHVECRHRSLKISCLLHWLEL